MGPIKRNLNLPNVRLPTKRTARKLWFTTVVAQHLNSTIRPGRNRTLHAEQRTDLNWKLVSFSWVRPAQSNRQAGRHIPLVSLHFGLSLSRGDDDGEIRKKPYAAQAAKVIMMVLMLSSGCWSCRAPYARRGVLLHVAAGCCFRPGTCEIQQVAERAEHCPGRGCRIESSLTVINTVY